MPLSDDIAAIDAYLGCCAAGLFRAAPKMGELRLVLRGLADRAAELERTLEMAADQLSPGRDHAALAAGLASGKVTLLAAHRVARLPDLPQPGWSA